MPRKKRVSKKREDITPEQEAWLLGDYRSAGFTNYLPEEQLAALWNRFADDLLAEYAAEYPGSRPGRFWKYSAPEMRKRIGGVGTPCFEVLNYCETFKYGIPVDWIMPWHVEFYSQPQDSYGFRATPLSPGAFRATAVKVIEGVK